MDSNFMVDFLEGLNTPAIYNCEQCDLTFKEAF